MLEAHMKQIGVHMPMRLVFPVYQEDFDGPIEQYVARKAREVLGKFSAPWIVKSLNAKSDMGIHIAKTFPELVRAISDCISHKESILVEELISGKPASMHSLSGFRGDEVYAFPAGNFSTKEKEELITLTKNIHKHLDVKDYLKTDFIISPHKRIYLMNVSFLPDLTKDSAFTRACESIGAKSHQVLAHILNSNSVL